MDIIRKTKNQTNSNQSSVIKSPKKTGKFFDFKKLKINSKFKIQNSKFKKIKNIFNTKKKKLFLSLLFILLLILPAYFIFFHNKAGASWWNSDWFYRKSIQVTNNTTTQNNVYINLTLDTSNPDKFQDDCGDIRFVRQNGEVLPYYIVSGCRTSSTVIHTNFPVFDAGTQTINFYYGNPTVENGFELNDFSTPASNYTIGTIGQEELGPSPVLYLPFDEGFGTTAYDESSNRNDGTIVGATWKDESMCKNGKCLEFDGNGDYVEINDNQSLDLDKEVTLEAWIKPTTTDKKIQTILSKEETPTDPTKIYRSVGPSATSAITTGTTNSLNITGDKATFQTALPDNIGVGDVIQYDDDDDGDIDTNDSLAFIVERITSYEYRITNASGTTPTPINSDNNWSIFRAYTSLANAESGIENTGIDSDLRNFDDWTAGGDATTDDVGKDLVSANQQWNIACYANGTTADTALVSIDGWITGALNFVKVYTPVYTNEVGVSQRHGGKWDDGKYKLVPVSSSGGTININDYFTEIEGLQIKTTRSTVGSIPSISIFTSNSLYHTVRISSNIIVGNFSNGATGSAIYPNDGSTYVVIKNNLIYNFTSGSRGISLMLSSGVYAYNNTIFNSDICYFRNSGTFYAKNNILQNCTTDFSGTFDSSSTNNLTNNTPSASNAIGTTYTTGTTTGTTASKLINSTDTFITKKIQIGSIIKNTTDNTYTYVTAIDSETQLSIANDIFVSGEGYTIYTNKYGTASFVSTTSGSEDFHLNPTDTVAKNSGADLSQDNIFPFATDIDGQSRFTLNTKYQIQDTAWDIGADEAQATQIYRSVAPNKTDALETGTDNAMTIGPASNGVITATFQRALADNIGVGDVIQYDDDNDGDIDANDSLAFIVERITNYEYRITNSSGGVPPQAINDNDWSIFRAYTSLANAENGDENTGIDSDLRNFDTWTGGKDLVTSKEQWNIACYANGTTPDTTAVTIDGWTTGIQNFVKVYTPTKESEVGITQRHGGKWDDGKYRLETGTGANSFKTSEHYTEINGLQITNSGSASIDDLIFLDIWFNYSKVSNNILKGGYRGINFGANATYGGHKVFNNIVYNSAFSGIAFTSSVQIPSYIYNNTIYHTNLSHDAWADGITNSCANSKIFNNIVMDNYYVGSYTTSISNVGLQSNNITSDASATGTGSLINQTLADIDFVSTTSGSEDLRILGTSVARNIGTSSVSLSPSGESWGEGLKYDIEGEKRETYDIGADEATATKIYRSVGPNNTTALATDESHENTVSVTNGIATFEKELPDRVGVGDAVLIDTNNDNSITSADTLLFIHGRTSSTVYTLRTHTGSIPNDISSNDTYQIFRAYTSLANAESGTKNTSIPITTFNGGNRDLVTNNEEWNIACYGDSVDTTEVTVDGWTTGTENSIKIYTPFSPNEVGISQRHKGKWDDEKYRILKNNFAGNGSVIYIIDLFVSIEGLQIGAGINVSAFANAVWIGSMDNANISLTNNIVKQISSTAGNVIGFNMQADNGSVMNVSNNILYGFTQGTAYTIASANASGSISYIYNNTINSCAYGIAGTGGQGLIFAKNNVVQNCSVDGYYGTYETGSDFNISYKAADAPGANSKNSTTVTFRDAANDDFRLAMNDTAAKGAGINLSNDLNLPISLDIEGELRPSLRQGFGVAMPSSLNTNYLIQNTAFDIGADQISTTTHNNYSLSLNTNYPQVSYSTGFDGTDEALPRLYEENFSSGDSDLNPNEWSHIAYKRSNNQEEIYINGSKKDSKTISNFLKTNNGKLYIGSKNTSSKDSFKGFLDEIKIYPYARTEAEIKKDKVQGSSGRASSRATEGTSVSIGDTSSSLNDGLVGYWKMDEASWTGAVNEVKDASGNNNHGMRYGNATIGAGKFGNGGVFDGEGDHVMFPNSEKWRINNFSVSTWIKFDSETGSYNMPVASSDGAAVRYYFDVRNSGIYFKVYNGSSWITATHSVNPVNNWFYITGIFDGNNVILYINGEKIQSVNFTGSYTPNNFAPTIGNYRDITGNTYAFDGQIDETRIYNRALSSEEVRELYNYAPAPILHLKMDEKEGATAYDSSGNNNHGTLTNSPAWETGKIGSSLKFNGNDTLVSIPTSPVTEKLDYDMTISGWLKGIGNDVNDELIGSYHGFGSGYFQLRYDSGGILRGAVADGSTPWVTSSANLNDDKWHHFSYVRSANDLKAYLYIDGKLNDSDVTTASALVNWETCPVYIGNSSIIDHGFTGNIDDIRIYNYARTPKQILEDMGGGEFAKGQAQALKSPVLDLNFNEGQGSTAYDKSMSKNNGTLTPGAGGTNTTATAMWDKGGKKGGAMEFDGTDDYIEASAALQLTGGNFTINTFFNSEHTLGSLQRSLIYNGEPSYSGEHMEMYIDKWDGKIYAKTVTEYNTSTSVSPSGYINGSGWHMVSYVRGANNDFRLYIDGILVDTDNTVLNYVSETTETALLIGNNDVDTGFFDGKIDEVKIYNYALSEDEIKTLYNDSSAMTMGNDESRNNNGAQVTGGSKDYCIPGDTAKCDKPVLELKMDEKTGTTTYDSSGNGYNGTLTNGPVWDRGKKGSALHFDGVNDYVVARTSPILSGLPNWTVSAWIKTNASSAANGRSIYAERAPAGNDILKLDSLITSKGVNTACVTYRDDAGNLNQMYGSKVINDNQWHHITGSLNNSYLYLYVDGILDKSAARIGTDSLTNSGMQSWIGNDYGVSMFLGEIDDVKIYDYARTPAQIAWDYNQGKEMNYWKFDEGSGTTVHDEGVDKKNGTITGATWRNESECKNGKCLYFNGLDDQVSTGANVDLSGTNKISVAFWFKYNSASSAKIMFEHSGDFNINNAFLVDNSEIGPNGSLVLSDHNTGYNIVNTSSSYGDNQWHHFIGVIDRSLGIDQNKIFIDGVEAPITLHATYRNDLSGNFGSFPVYLGSRTGTSFDYNGQLDDVKIFNYALNAEQAKMEYNNSSAVNFR